MIRNWINTSRDERLKTHCFKPTSYSRVILVMIIGFGLKLGNSCTPPPPIEFSYNVIKVVGIDNSGRSLSISAEIDSMFADAVAFGCYLSDSSMTLYSFVPNHFAGINHTICIIGIDI